MIRFSFSTFFFFLLVSAPINRPIVSVVFEKVFTSPYSKSQRRSIAFAGIVKAMYVESSAELLPEYRSATLMPVAVEADVALETLAAWVAEQRRRHSRHALPIHVYFCLVNWEHMMAYAAYLKYLAQRHYKNARITHTEMALDGVRALKAPFIERRQISASAPPLHQKVARADTETTPTRGDSRVRELNSLISR